MDKQMYKELVSTLIRKESQLRQQIIELTMENAELKDELIELGVTIRETPNDMELGEKLRRDSWKKEETNPNQLNLFDE
jgi:regulator of replication initiation timing